MAGYSNAFSSHTHIHTQGDFGPFNPSMPTKVPLWLAVNLKKQHKCRVQAPEWLCVGELLGRQAGRMVKDSKGVANPLYDITECVMATVT